MNKKYMLLIVFVLALGLLLSACNTPSDPISSVMPKAIA